MTNASNADIRHFLEQFFGTDNKFDLGKIERGEGKQAKISPWVELLTKGERQPTILPCWRSESVDWYAIALSERQLRRLSEELMAFIGPTYSTFRGQRAQLNPQDPIELAVYEFTGGAAVKLCGQATDVWEALEQMRRVSERRVKRVADIPRPTGRVLRDFYMALQAGDAYGGLTPTHCCGKLTTIPCRPASSGCAESAVSAGATLSRTRAME